MRFSLQPVKVATGAKDETGALVLLDGRMVAVLVKLADECHADAKGHWYLEAGFGRVGLSSATFPHIVDALRLITERLGIDRNAEILVDIASIGGRFASPESQADQHPLAGA